MNIQSEVGSFLFSVRDLTQASVAETLVTLLRDKQMGDNEIREIVTRVKASIGTTFSSSADQVTRVFKPKPPTPAKKTRARKKKSNA